IVLDGQRSEQKIGVIGEYADGRRWDVSDSASFSCEKSEDRPPPLSFAVRAAWENAGAETGWMRERSGFLSFRDGLGKAEAGDVPAFRWIRKPLEAGVLSKLPAPDKGFGLDLQRTKLTDVEMKELTRFNQLVLLNLAFNQVTDSGLKELLPLKRLRSLSVAFTKVTDDG